jgi:K+-transporting ATPase ATPase A chain
MTGNGWLQLGLYVAVLLLLAKPLGGYMARVYQGEPVFLDRLLRPIERLVYAVLRVSPEAEMGWKTYALAMLLFNAVGFLVVYGIQRLQGLLPLNPQQFGAASPDLSFNTAVSFITNTNWQSYGGESTMSYLTQMSALAVQNFLSAATGMAVLVAMIRGFSRHSTQTIPLGPAASQVAIKQLGTNGGGFFNVNSAYPFENPTPLSNFLEVLAILLISGALCYTFGKMVKDTRQGWAVLAAMTIVFVGLLLPCVLSEQGGNPALADLGVDQHASATQPGGNMEGKEVRFGVVNSALWATATTSASNGSVNSMHDSFTPLGGLVPLWLIQLGEIIYGGVGSGLYGMLLFVIVTVFIAGLMVGRTPEYLGKKIEAYEMKMASIGILIPNLLALGATAIAVSTAAGRAGPPNPGPHGFTEILYAFSSMSNNNGSAFAGISANTPFYNVLGGICMWLSRYWVAIPALAVAGSLAAKKRVPASAGTLATDTPLFVVLLVGTVVIVGALTHIPGLALGPIVEHLMLPGR